MNHSQGRSTKVGVARTRERSLVPGNNDVELIGSGLIAVKYSCDRSRLDTWQYSGRLSYWPGELRGGSRRKMKQRDRSESAETIQPKEHPTTQVEKLNFVFAYC